MSDIHTFMQSFKGDIVTPNDPNYKQAIARWAVNAERPASIVAFVKDIDDIALALKYARTNKLQVAIRCGGHSPSGASSAEDGLIIDLSRYYNYAVVDPAKRTVRIGGGSLWETVDKEAIKHGLATVAGTVNHGLLLGGGYGFLTGQHGLVVDNLIQATLVTADGTVLTLSDTENTELFWGIRGGGSNFGVCTEFVLRLHPQRRTVFAGIVVFPAEVLDALMAVLTKWWKTVKNNEGILQILGRGPGGRECISLNLFYNGSEDEGRKNFKRFYDLGPIVDGAREIPFEQLNGIMNETFAHGYGYYLKSVFQSSPRAHVVKSVFEKITQLNAAPGNEIEHGYLFEYVPHHTVMTLPENATSHLRSHRGMTGSALKWTNNTPAVEQAAKKAARELTDIVAIAEAQASDGKSNSGYGNFSGYHGSADSETQAESADQESMSRTLFGPNYGPLQRLKHRYDPENVFWKWFAIAPNAGGA
ncbi:FAD-binding domain-containing protein [Multifurca ochricompacta]|uniref:FAD-binding domain-containing protein n=1 Tax=Multifurca ochricompacta TaxID=376703 RepID=A0AAD4LY12_9AGAM|nr:FAD-binding domain-containing protein [Multifurca ochricompacta]